MRPIKRKEISEKVAERLNLSSETVDEIVSCYYNIIQRKLSQLEFPSITVDNLGTFFVKRPKLEEKLMIYRKSLEKYESIKQPDMAQFKSIMELKADIHKFENILAELDKLDVKKQEKQQEKITYKNNKS